MRKNQRLPITRTRALEVYAWVKHFKREHNYLPSIAEVSEGLGLAPSHIRHIRRAMIDFRLMDEVPPKIERTWPFRPIPRDFVAGTLGSPSTESP